jgi:uncharacterized protein with ATP-grasp and redox domains
MTSLEGVTLSMSPAEVSTIALRAVTSRLEDQDAFKEIKREHIRLALTLYRDLERIVEESEDSLSTALRLSASANLIDLGTKDEIDLTGEMRREISRELKRNDLELFKERVDGSRSILWIADNAC